MVQLSHPYMTTRKTIVLTRCTFVSKVMSLLFSILTRFVIAFFPRSKHLLISWLQSPSIVILEPKKIKVSHCFHCFPIYFPWSGRTGHHDLVFWMLSFKPACENLHQEDLSFLSAFHHWVVSSVYLKLLLFLLAILIILVFHPDQHLYTVYSAYKFYLCLDCCKQCCNEHWGVCILLNHGFNPDICPEAEKEMATHSNILA